MILIGYVVAETPRALFFHDHFWSKPDWMPKSQVTITRDPDTTEIVLSASPWICNQKGIREFQYRDVPEREDG